MKKTIIVLTMISLFLIGCGSRPPIPKLTSGKTEIPVVMGTYSWRSFNKHVIADAPGATDLMIDKNPTSIQPNAEIRVSFSNKPDKMIWAKWVGNEIVDEVELKSNKFILPTEKGEYIYSINASWGKNNSGLYAFKVSIE